MAEFGPIGGDAVNDVYPDYKERVAAAVSAGGEVVAKVGTPYRWTLGLGWNDVEEARFRAAIVGNAHDFAAAKGLGPIRMENDPGTEGETDIGG